MWRPWAQSSIPVPPPSANKKEYQCSYQAGILIWQCGATFPTSVMIIFVLYTSPGERRKSKEQLPSCHGHTGWMRNRLLLEDTENGLLYLVRGQEKNLERDWEFWAKMFASESLVIQVGGSTSMVKWTLLGMLLPCLGSWPPRVPTCSLIYAMVTI